MTKAREAGSYVAAIDRVRVALGDEYAERATGRSVHLIRKWADPDDDAHHIPLYQAIALDLKSIDQGMAPLILEAYQRAVDAHREDHRIARAFLEPPLERRFAEAVGEIGDVGKAIAESLADQKMSAAERRRIGTEIQEAREKLDALARAVSGGAQKRGRK